MRGRTSIDDALDVFACHGVAGIVGALLTGVFATKSVNPAGANGLLFGNARLLGVQALAVVCTIAFTAPVTALALARLRAVGSLRVPLPDELSGVDVSEHGEHAYDDGEMSALAGGGLGISEPVVHSDDEGRHANVGSRVGAGAGRRIAAPLLTTAATVRPTRSSSAPNRPSTLRWRVTSSLPRRSARVELDSERRPVRCVPNSTKRASDGSYQVRVPVESTDDMRSQPFSPMWSSIQQSMNATALLHRRVGERMPRPAERHRRAAPCAALSFFKRLRTKRKPNGRSPFVLGAVT